MRFFLHCGSFSFVPSFRTVSCIFALLSVVNFVAGAVAQIPSVTDTTSTPVPNAGHDYIQGMNETVNPANGSLSIRIGVPLPPSRGFTLPFNFAYDSNGADYVAIPCGGGGQCPNTASWVTTTSQLAQGGWSYSVPMMSVQLTTATMQTVGPTGIAGTFTCDALINFVLQDMGGNRHNLGLSYFNSANVCQNSNNGTGSGAEGVAAFPETVVSAEEGPLLAQTTSTWPAIGNKSPGHVNPVTVTDGDGTTYNFGSHNSPQLGCCNTTTGTYPPDSIVDRNGNAYSISYGLIPGTPALTYTDSIGRTALSIPTFGASTDQVTVSGLNSPYQVSWTTISPHFSVAATSQGLTQCSFPTTQSAIQAVSSITLPNGQQYVFSYDPVYGMVNKITYPTGGYVRYVWGVNPQSQYIEWPYYVEQPILGSYENPILGYYPYAVGSCSYIYDSPAVAQRFVSYDGTHEVLEQDFSYATTGWGANGWSQKQATVATKDLVRGTTSPTIYTYGPVLPDYQPNTANQIGPSAQLPVETQIQYYGTNGSLLKTVSKTWGNERTLLSQKTQIQNNQETETVWNYNANEMKTDQYDYGFGTGAPGSLMRHTVVPSYHSFATHIVDKPDSVVVKDGNGNVAAGVSYGYDPNGNLLTRSNWLNATGTSALTTSHTYDSYGNMLTTTDPNTNKTTYTYADAFVDTCPSITSPSNAYLTNIAFPTTNGVAHTESFKWHCATGLLASSTDENLQTTSYIYNDSFNRLTQTNLPDGGSSTYAYNDTAPNPTITTTTLMNTGGQTTVSAARMDGMFHPIETQLLSDPAGITFVDTVYDGSGQVYSKSNPYRSGDPINWTTYTYDALSRPVIQQHPDGSTLKWCYDGLMSDSSQSSSLCVPNASSLSNVSWVDSYDELMLHSQHVTDGLGRLVAATEQNPQSTALSLQTDYSYDVLGNLLSANQIGISPETPRARSFSYDMLSRLITSTNPETGTICYGTTGGAVPTASNCAPGYDPNGNLQYKTDARGVTTQYGYDALNRLVTKSYPGSNPIATSTPTSSFTYDTPTGSANTNTIGRLTAESVVSGGNLISQRSGFSYDAMGRVLGLQECVFPKCGTPYSLNYTYDLAGNTLTSTNGLPAPTPAAPSPNYAQLTNVYDGAGRLASVTSSWHDGTTHPATLFQAAGYSPAGGLTAASLGLFPANTQPSLSLVRGYDNRLRVDSEADTMSSSQIQPATYATGSITLTGTTDQQLTQSATSGTGNIMVLGSEGSNSVCTGGGLGTLAVTQSISANNQCKLIPDTGSLVITIYGPTTFTATVPYGATSTEAKLANAIANALGTASSPVAASPVIASWTSGTNVVQFTSKATGSVSNYQFSVDTNSNGNTDDFYGSDSGAMTGGASGGTFYDSGTMSISVNGGTPLSVTWQAGSSISSLLSSLQNALAPYANLLQISATATGLNLTAKQSGTGGDLNLACSQTDTSGQFPSPSFTVSCSGLSGGVNAVYAPTTAYSYSIANSSGIPGSGYAPNGNLNNVTDSVIGSWAYSYDNLNRLTGATGQSGNYGSLAVSGVNLVWSYDSFGNRYSQTSNSSNFPTTWANYAATNQMTASSSAPGGISYDAAGNVTNDGNNQYLYDAEGKVCAVTSSLFSLTTQYVYDAEGQRVAKMSGGTPGCAVLPTFSPSTTYLRGAHGELVTELAGNNWNYSNVYANGSLLATYRGNNTYFALNDWLGTKRAEITPDGQTASFASLPFGDFLTQQGNATDATEDHFTGKERDAESGLDYFGARYYGSNMGRFSSPDDPIFADQVNPQSWNLYSYVENNPITNTDPDGHDCVVQSRTSNTTETVTTSTGNCDKVSVGDGQTKTYVPGTVTGIKVNGSSLDIGYNSYDGESSGVVNANSAPIPNNPGLAYNWGNNAQGYQQLGAASRAVKAGTVGYAVVFGSVMGAGLVADALAGGGLTTIGDVASPLLTSQEAADAIGWGTHFEGEGLQATKDLAAKLTQNEVSEMESKGLTLGDAEKWRKVYQTAVNAGRGGEQAKARLMLMNKIIRIMVGGR